MNKKIFYVLLSSVLALTGCWDQQPLKNARLVFAASFDLTDDNKILTTAVVRSLRGGSRGTQNIEAANVFVTAKGNTLRDTRIAMDRKLSGEFSPNKNRILVIGEDLALRRDLYPLFDILYRDPRSSLGAKVIIGQGRADDIVKMNMVGQVLVGEEIFKLIHSAEENSLVPVETVQSICTKIFDPGQDLMLPYIKKIAKGDEFDIDIVGDALFHKQKFTGHVLKGDDPTLLLLLNDKQRKFARFSIKVNPKDPVGERYITIQVKKSKVDRNIHIHNGHEVSVDFNLDFEVIAIEYPKDKLYDPKEITKLNKKLSKSLTECTNHVIKQIQDANSDVLALGRDLISFHPDVWKQLDWDKEFPNIPIKAKVNVTIIDTGIIK
ncbi:Ger(x)C family spore germination protein [Falsibacillus albus]|uniref:Ger(X)C family spore germination protein n=1 Tax=Falsibacillus albus TaxID=2478915 RepID=A0A3L7JX17_9BACI|nr:Ger(x)C family spore germination protein [Falsibacillus albus]RLQ94201.1 Ger(x)C family spore germination protein [Falsibacillus albus]